MPRGPSVRRADIERAVAALEACGHAVEAVEVMPGGGVRVILRDLTAPASPASLDEFTAWNDRRGLREA
jgi:hypothetical protein